MNYKKYFLIFMVTLLLLLVLRYNVLYKSGLSQEMLISTAANNTSAITSNNTVQEDTVLEKRGAPTYDYTIGRDRLPHYRVFFWIPSNAVSLVPYADKGINTDVSHHGPVEEWNVVITGKVNDNEKLVFIYIPKTFVFLYGRGFEKVIHLKYKIIDSHANQASTNGQDLSIIYIP
jgi:hypothetical protein